MAKKLGLMILLLVIMLVSCSKSNDCALASPQKSRPSSEWRRKLIQYGHQEVHEVLRMRHEIRHYRHGHGHRHRHRLCHHHHHQI
ncbi:unnamed protein product, partial [Arabidopsis lyrata]